MGGAAPSPVLGGGGFRGGVNGGVGGGGGVIGDHPFRPLHPRVSPPPYHYLYSTPPSAMHPMSYPATYPAPPRQQTAASIGDYVIGHAVSPGDALMQQQPQPRRPGGFSCFGAPFSAPPQTAVAANGHTDHASCNCSFGCGGHSRNVNASS
jgi:hypothetical protein